MMRLSPAMSGAAMEPTSSCTVRLKCFSSGTARANPMHCCGCSKWGVRWTPSTRWTSNPRIAQVSIGCAPRTALSRTPRTSGPEHPWNVRRTTSALLAPIPTTLRRRSATRIAILGVGGIGSVVLAHLASAGFSRYTLIDGDTVQLHNLNRQIVYCFSDVGRRKVDVAADLAPDT